MAICTFVTRCSGPMADTRGFSILELVVTLSLASILAGISVLSHNALRPRLNLGMATRQVVMDLQVTRMRAVAHNASATRLVL